LERRPRVNYQIRASQVLVIDETGKRLGVLDTKEALKLAEERGLDLVEVAPQQNPPIAKLMDFGKWLYKKEKEKKKSGSGIIEMKTIRVGFLTEDHDLEIKAKKVDEFLRKNYKVNIELLLRGREIGFKDLAKEKIKSFLNFIKEPYQIEKDLEIKGKKISLIIKKGK
jgi:translation initiation factor IF-3